MLLSKVKKWGVDPNGEYDVLIKVNNLSSSSDFRIPVYGYWGTNYSWTFSVDGGAEYVLSWNRSATPITINLTWAGEHTIAIRGSDFRCLWNGGDTNYWGTTAKDTTFTVKTYNTFNVFNTTEIANKVAGNDICNRMYRGAEELTGVDMKFKIPSEMVVGHNFFYMGMYNCKSLANVKFWVFNNLKQVSNNWFQHLIGYDNISNSNNVNTLSLQLPDLELSGIYFASHFFRTREESLDSRSLIIIAPKLMAWDFSFSDLFVPDAGDAT